MKVNRSGVDVDLAKHLPLGIAVLDARGHITQANRRLREWLHLMTVDSNNAPAADPRPAGGGPADDFFRELCARVVAGDELPVSQRLAVGELLLKAHCELLPEDPGFLLVVEDVTGTTRDERALHDANTRLAELLAERSRELNYNREFLRSLIETNRDLVLAVDEVGVITFANKGFVGAAAGALIGKMLDDIVEVQYHNEFARQYRDVLSGQATHTLFEAPGAGILRDHWCLFSIGPMRGSGGVSGLTAIISDLTALQDARERLRGDEKLVATGRMAARIAHEINNPLTGIAGAIQLIKADLPAGSAAGSYAEMVDREISRISNVVRQMYGLYRPEHEASRVVDLRPLIDEVVTLMRVDATHRQVRLLSLITARETARVQEQNLRQILMNIVRNAVEVTAAGGVVEISVERHGRCVDVVIADQGPGITDELQQQMFEPFFTTKSSSGGRGLGLGLSISDTLVKAMGGGIVFENGLAGGARCKICLPEAGDQGDASAGRRML